MIPIENLFLPYLSQEGKIIGKLSEPTNTKSMETGRDDEKTLKKVSRVLKRLLEESVF